MYAFDLETHLIAPLLQAPPIVCAAWANGSERGIVTADYSALVYGLIRGAAVGHNVAFDLGCVCAADPGMIPSVFRAYEENRITDTGLRAKLLDIAKGCYRGFRKMPDGSHEKLGYGLDDLVWRYFGVKLDKTTHRLNFGALDSVPIAQWPAGAAEYVMDDAEWALKVWKIQEANRFDGEKDYLEDEFRQARAAWWMRLMSAWGLITDPVAVKKYAEMKTAERETLAMELATHGLVSNVKGKWKRSIKPAQAMLAAAYRERGQSPPETEKGSIQLDDAACTKSGSPIMLKYAELASVTHALSGDVPLLFSGSITPIHTHFEEILETGRTSTSPNTQNLPREPGVRECYVPRPGFVYAAADYSTLELRTLAQVLFSRFGQSKLRDMLNVPNSDVHAEVAGEILGIPWQEVNKRRKAGDAAAENARQCGKVANFGFPGGLGPARFVHFALKSYKTVITESASRRLKEQWLATWPEFKEYFRWLSAEMEAPRPQIRQLFSNRYRGGLNYTEACGGFNQALAADAAKAAGWNIAKACYVGPSVLYGSRPVNFMHDEFLVEVPEPIAHECAVELARLMQEGAAPWMPDCPPVVGDPVLMRRWSKNAKSELVKGRLTIWSE